MVIIRDEHGNIIGKEASAPYVATRKLRARHEQALCDKQLGIVREDAPKAKHGAKQRMLETNLKRVQAGMEPVYDDPGLRCGCEDAPCCGC